MGQYSMPFYFKNMPVVGNPVQTPNAENKSQLTAVEDEIKTMIETALAEGRDDKSLNDAGQLTARQRLTALIDAGTWRPLNSLFNPEGNDNGSTGIIKGLAKISGKWAVVVASDNKKLAGAWVPGQAENLIRASDAAKILGIPLVYVLNCSGVKFDEQDRVYPNRRGGGTPFFRNAELEKLGIPVIVGIYGTNPAGGGYHSISPAILIAHKDANMAVGGAGILGGMNPKGFVDRESAQALIDATVNAKKTNPPGAVPIHFNETGFFREVYGDEKGVLDGIKKYMAMLPAYNPDFFRVDDPAQPKFPAEDLYSIVPYNQKRVYDVYDLIARLFDNSELLEFKQGYGPEMVTGLAKINGLLIGVIANAQGLLMNYPEYKTGSVGIGGKLYRQGLVKMNEFVSLCDRDKIPVIWLQDTTGIDVGDEAEKAELLGLGQSLIYSIENSCVPHLEITVRKGSAAAHYVLGGPQANNHNAFSLGTAATEMYVMNGETAAAAMYARRLVKDQKDGKDIQETIDKMNQIISEYTEKSRPKYCAMSGMVDEIVDMPSLRLYLEAFTEAVYQNKKAICPFHQMLLPRVIREFVTYKK
jgi:glutaconyl-CoA decarboxylase